MNIPVKTDDIKYVTITVNSEIYKKIPLDENTHEDFVVKTDKGTNAIVIKDGIADVYDADCPDLVCVNSAPISDIGDMIVCLPHKMIVEITYK